MKIIHIACILFLFSCSSPGTKDALQQYTDSASSPATYAADTAAAYYEDTLTVDDTIKALLRVYVAAEDGAPMLQEMNPSAQSYERVEFCDVLDVIGIYPDWYKVRTGYLNNSDIFYIPISFTDKEFPATVVLRYPAFELTIKGIRIDNIWNNQFDGGHDPLIKVHEYMAEEKYETLNVLDVKADTVMLDEQFDSYFAPNRIHIKPKHTGDRFKISCAFIHGVYEWTQAQTEGMSPAQQNAYKQEIKNEMTPYTVLPDSLLYYFSLPQHVESASSYATAYKQVLKKKYQLRDSILNIPVISESTDTVHVVFTKNGKLFQYGIADTMYLRIDRISGGKIVETRYLTIFHTDEGC